MKIKRLTLSIFIFFALLTSSFSENYFVKNGGDDNATGLSDEQAWETISKVNSMTFNPGDTISFNRGDLWREQLIVDSGSLAGYVIYKAYGVGDKPKLMCSKEENEAGDWTNLGGNIWSNDDSYFDVDVGNIIFNNGENWGIKVENEVDVDADLEFWYDSTNDLIKIYSSSNPATRFNDVEVAINKHIANQAYKSYVEYNDLNFLYTGAHGIGGGSTSFIKVKDCDFYFIGGSYQNTNIRYGNGVEFWKGSSDSIVERCYFDQIYDAAMTNQSNSPEDITQERIYFINNIVKNSHYGYEFFVQGAGTNRAANIYVENNTFYNCGNEWSYDQRSPLGTPRTFSIHDIQEGVLISLYIRNNLVFGDSHPEDYDIFWWYSGDFTPHNLILDYNLYYTNVDADTDIFNLGFFPPVLGKRYYTLNEFSDYQTGTGWDVNSIIADPLFIDSTNNYALSSNSPAKDVGYSTLNVKKDFRLLGRPQDAAYDIGAYEVGAVIKAEGVTFSGLFLSD